MHYKQKCKVVSLNLAHPVYTNMAAIDHVGFHNIRFWWYAFRCSPSLIQNTTFHQNWIIFQWNMVILRCQSSTILAFQSLQIFTLVKPYSLILHLHSYKIYQKSDNLLRSYHHKQCFHYVCHLEFKNLNFGQISFISFTVWFNVPKISSWLDHFPLPTTMFILAAVHRLGFVMTS